MSEFEGPFEEQYTSIVRSRFEKYEDDSGIILGNIATDPEDGSDIRSLLFSRHGATGLGDKLILWGKNALNVRAARVVPVFGLDWLEIRNSAQKSLANGTSAQSPFTAANDTITVEAGALYEFESMIATVQGTTSHTVAFGFGGTATFTDCAYYSEHVSVTDATLASNDVDNKFTKAATPTVITPAITATGTIIWLRGSFLVNAGGTIIPQITFSADPTGTCECHIGSFFRALRLPSAAVGPVA